MRCCRPTLFHPQGPLLLPRPRAAMHLDEQLTIEQYTSPSHLFTEAFTCIPSSHFIAALRDGRWSPHCLVYLVVAFNLFFGVSPRSSSLCVLVRPGRDKTAVIAGRGSSIHAVQLSRSSSCVCLCGERQRRILSLRRLSLRWCSLERVLREESLWQLSKAPTSDQERDWFGPRYRVFSVQLPNFCFNPCHFTSSVHVPQHR